MPPLPPRPIPELPGVEHRFVDARGVRFHVAEAGDPMAEPVVLLHGWPEHFYAWRRIIGPLAERYRVIAPDLRGFGWSEAPPGGYLKSELAADVVALLDALELDRVRLAGHDWGGFTSFLVALDHPERVSHLAVAGMSHPWVEPDEGLAARLTTLRRISYMFVLAAPGIGANVIRRIPNFTRTVLRKSSVDPDATWTPEEMEQFVAQWAEPDRAAAGVGIYRSFLTKELPELARGGFRNRVLEMPAVLFCGVADPVIRPRNLEGFEANAPQMTLEVVEDAGHWLPEEAPGALLSGMSSLWD